MQHRKIGFLGGGNMGEAIIGALLRSRIFPEENIMVSDASEDRLKYMGEIYGIVTLKDNHRLFVECDTVVLAVKPQQMTDVARGGHPEQRLRHRAANAGDLHCRRFSHPEN